MELVNKTLTTTMFPLEEAKTGENIGWEILKLLVTKFGLDASSLSKIVWVTDKGANIKLALRPNQRLDCIDHVINTLLRHELNIAELSKANSAPDLGDINSAAKSLIRLKRHCQPNALDSPQQAVKRKCHKDWLVRKVIIQELHKFATFLWPKFNQMRMLSHSYASHGCRCTRCEDS
ncbi:hypothetical protein DPX16_0268 [Anabarilius grahami]|uniref:Uncharacterized protein n=1 Tax=Anabarilius grahami TaxID=495550 RepID=A0A3N0XW72_ANAGA|nr:hypothetical protein DPX16_0268 [Anabarilius grahami]